MEALTPIPPPLYKKKWSHRETQNVYPVLMAEEPERKKKAERLATRRNDTGTSDWSLLPQVIFRSAFNTPFSYLHKPASAGVGRRGKTDGNYFCRNNSKNFQVLRGGYVLYWILLSRSFWKNIKKAKKKGRGGDVELKLNYGVWYVSLHPVPSILSEKVQ